MQLTDMEALNAELEDANTQLEGALQRAAGEKDEALQAAEAAREEAAEQASLRRDAEAYVAELKNTYATLKVRFMFLHFPSYSFLRTVLFSPLILGQFPAISSLS